MSNFSLSGIERALAQSKDKARENIAQPAGPQMCGDIDIRITRDGAWQYLGSPIHRKRLVKLFASVLKRDASGDFWLITPNEMCRISVDDAPFTAVEMTIDGKHSDQDLIFRTNIDEIVTAGPDHPIRVDIDPKTGEPSPYLLIRDGLEALIVRSVFYDLVEIGEEKEVDGKSVFGVRSGGRFLEIGSLADA